ncbi:MAG: hypothetical protein KIT69_18995 [Propionibacteriaceae bacterium]|nr:hypothetical protein [Propionibacteriaceae bacterium]
MQHIQACEAKGYFPNTSDELLKLQHAQDIITKLISLFPQVPSSNGMGSEEKIQDSTNSSSSSSATSSFLSFCEKALLPLAKNACDKLGVVGNRSASSSASAVDDTKKLELLNLVETVGVVAEFMVQQLESGLSSLSPNK